VENKTAMTGETELTRLLKTMAPQRQPGEYVFCTLPNQTRCPADLTPVGSFQEAEGLTLILPRPQAVAAGLPLGPGFALITLTVHSSLTAVGFLAAIATHLARHGISVNPVSAYYHDHLFVPVADADRAIALLQTLAAAPA
jgi:hypothetical protein